MSEPIKNRANLVKIMMLDERFNATLKKIQDAIISLQNIAKSFEQEDHTSVSSQVLGLEVAAEDLKDLKAKFQELRKPRIKADA